MKTECFQSMRWFQAATTDNQLNTSKQQLSDAQADAEASQAQTLQSYTTSPTGIYSPATIYDGINNDSGGLVKINPQPTVTRL